jgi:hypothetical protein
MKAFVRKTKRIYFSAKKKPHATEPKAGHDLSSRLLAFPTLSVAHTQIALAMGRENMLD